MPSVADDILRWEPGIDRHDDSCPVDGNADVIVDLTDLANVLQQFGLKGIGLYGDADDNRVIDLTDLALVLSAFGGTCEN